MAKSRKKTRPATRATPRATKKTAPRQQRRPTRWRWAILTLAVIAGGLGAADAFYVKHPYFAMEGQFGFYAIFGTLACITLTLAARFVRAALRRREDYYDSDC